MKETRRSAGHLISEYSILTISIGIVYFWFGALKFFPGLSPAEDLAKDTIHCLTFGLIPRDISLLLLAIWEVGAGVMLITQIFPRFALNFTLVHILCTFVPLVCFPEQAFQNAPFVFTLLGQYIAKNIIILAALIILLRKREGAV